MTQEQANEQGILVVLGQNWEKGITKRHGTRRALSKSSIQTTLAADQLIQSGKYHTAIFSTGFTNGPHQPSEADAMADLLNAVNPDAQKRTTILRETNSYDTPTNIHETMAIITQRKLEGPIALVAPHYHMRRALTTAKGLGLPVAESCETEKVLGIRPAHTPVWEYVLRPLAHVDPEGKVPSLVTKTRRNPRRLLPSRKQQ